MPKIANIAKNTSYLTLALVFQKIISFTYFTLLARYIGPASLGKYYLALSFTTIFAIFIDLGFANVLIRVLNGETPDIILNYDLSFLDKIGLQEHLSPTRSNGLVSMIRQIKLYAVVFKSKYEQI